MYHIKTRLILLLIFIILLVIPPFYHFVNKLIERSWSIGVNKKVESALEESAKISIELFNNYRNEILLIAEEYSNSFKDNKLIISKDAKGRKNIVYNELIGLGKIDIYDKNGILLFTNTNFSTYNYPVLNKNKLNRLLVRSKTEFLKSNTNPKHISVFVPILKNSENLGGVIITKILNKDFVKATRNIVEANQMFKTFDFLKDEIKRGFLLYSVVIFAPVLVCALTFGFFMSRKITLPLIELSKATQIVGKGNWDYRIKVKSKDEIGQLVDAFNNMLETIKYNQQIAKEQSVKRRQIEEEHQLKIKDLEMAELESRALKAENESKTIELEKAQELEKAYQALEESHKHLKDTQAKLVQSEKMASLGNLAAGVAHEINNPIGAVNSAADVSMRAVKKIDSFINKHKSIEELRENKQFKQALQIVKDNTKLIVAASVRVIKIVRSLRTFARLDEAKYQSTDIHEGINSTLMLLQHEIKNRITIDKNYSNVPPILCYPDELNQVFMNVLANAAHAISGEGTICINTFIRENKVFVEIEDTGEGIPPVNISKIFDPGFTTKGVGVGTGLGMSISYNIIQKHNGEITVESELKRGTKFTLAIPLLLEE